MCLTCLGDLSACLSIYLSVSLSILTCCAEAFNKCILMSPGYSSGRHITIGCPRFLCPPYPLTCLWQGNGRSCIQRDYSSAMKLREVLGNDSSALSVNAFLRNRQKTT